MGLFCLGAGRYSRRRVLFASVSPTSSASTRSRQTEQESSRLCDSAHSVPMVCCSGVPQDYLLFQMGETAQIHSGGYLRATPHAVRGCSTPGVSRSTMAVFLEPHHAFDMVMPQNRCAFVVRVFSLVHLWSGLHGAPSLLLTNCVCETFSCAS